MPLIIYDLPKIWDIPDSNEFLDYPVKIIYNKGVDMSDIAKLLIYFQCTDYNELLEKIINNVVGS